MNDAAQTTREALLTSLERDEEELERALGELKEAVQRPFAIGEHVARHIAEHHVVWLGGALLVGLWLGAGRR